MKGFKKDGKFRPTEKKRRSPLTISQIRDKSRLEKQHGFKVYPKTQVSVQHNELPPEIVERVQYLWNNDPHMKKMRKHVDFIDLEPNDPDSPVIAFWDEKDKRFSLQEDYSTLEAELSTVHEVVGHAFWDWAKKWRRAELVEFNKLANELPPINDYMEAEEDEWRKMNDDSTYMIQLMNDHDYVLRNYYDPNDPDPEIEIILDDFNQQIEGIQADEGHQSMTRYANEMHSAITELMYGVGEQERAVFLDDDQLEELTDAWYNLHT